MPASVSPTLAPKDGKDLLKDAGKSRLEAPLQYSGLLDSFTWSDNTPSIGRQYENLSLTKDILDAPNSDDMLQDLATIISQRGVVFLKDQDITAKRMTELCSKISKASGSPQSSGLHIHPTSSAGGELGENIVIINYAKGGGGLVERTKADRTQFASSIWHSDITFEKVPADYSMLKIHTVPKTGGDTLWASGYELYDRLSPAIAKLLEGLTASHDGTNFIVEAARRGQTVHTDPRGSPLNIGDDLVSKHPCIRTNPVTGWKALFVNKSFTKRINDVTKDESDMLLAYIHNLLTQNHDLQVRYKWGKNDVAIWDNRSTHHCATHDYPDDRIGDRATSIGEVPYFDPASLSRRDALDRE